jgi:hypothetical protein
MQLLNDLPAVQRIKFDMPSKLASLHSTKKLVDRPGLAKKKAID